MARVWIWLLLLGVGLLHLRAPVVAVSAMTPARLGDVQISERIAERLVGSLRNHRYCFLGEAELSTLTREIATFAARYAPRRMPPAKQDALLEAVEKYVREHFSNPPLESPHRSLSVEGTYLMFRDVVNTFKWQPWRALTRDPLTPEQRAQRQIQHDWLREFIAGVPPNPSKQFAPHPRQEERDEWARTRVERELADPLGLLYDPLTSGQFEVFKAWMRRSAANGLVTTVSNIPRRALGARAHREASIEGAYAYPFDLDLPFEDEVTAIWGGGDGAGPHLAFASNVRFRGHDTYVYGRRRPILEVLKDAARLVRGQPRRTLARQWPPRRVGDITYDDEAAQLIALDGARLAKLDVADWFEADALTDAELRQVVKDCSVRRISVERLPPMNGPRHVGINEPRFFLVVRDRTDRLAVIDLRSREFGMLRLVIRERSKNSTQ